MTLDTQELTVHDFDRQEFYNTLSLGYPCKTGFNHSQLVVVHNFQSTLWWTVMFYLRCFERRVENHVPQIWLLRKKDKAIFEIWDPCMWVRRGNSKVYFSPIFVNDYLSKAAKNILKSQKYPGLLQKECDRQFKRSVSAPPPCFS